MELDLTTNYTKVKKSIIAELKNQLERLSNDILSSCKKCNRSGVCPECQVKLFTIYQYLEGVDAMVFCPNCVQLYYDKPELRYKSK